MNHDQVHACEKPGCAPSSTVALPQPRRDAPPGPRKAGWLFAALAVLLTIAFAGPLRRLVQIALGNEIHSYVLLVPFISAYLLRVPAQRGKAVVSEPSIRGAALAALAGVGLFAVATWMRGIGGDSAATSVMIAAYLLLLLAAGLFAFGWQALRPHLFAILFMVFFVPLPPSFVEAISIFLQHASADAADLLFRAVGLPVFRQGLSFKLPALTITVAEECSGIRSTLVLFITSVLAGHLFLRSPWRKAAFALAVVPLGILRNAFRILTLAWLTVKVDPRVMDSPLHHRGGPLFFLVSLLPLLALLWWLRRSERRHLPHATSM